MNKLNYLLKRMIAATIDLLIFALIIKALEPFIAYKDSHGKGHIDTGVFLLLFYLVFILQDIFFNKTIGKYLFKLEMKFDDTNEIKGLKKSFRLIIRRSFDLLEMVCPFIYILFILFTKNNQKLGDLISHVIVAEKQKLSNKDI